MILMIVVVSFIALTSGMILLHCLIIEIDNLQTMLYKMGLNIVTIWKAGQDARLEVKERSSLLEDSRELRNHQLDYLAWQTLARKAIKSHRENT